MKSYIFLHVLLIMVSFSPPELADSTFDVRPNEVNDVYVASPNLLRRQEAIDKELSSLDRRLEGLRKSENRFAMRMRDNIISRSQEIQSNAIPWNDNDDDVAERLRKITGLSIYEQAKKQQERQVMDPDLNEALNKHACKVCIDDDDSWGDFIGSNLFDGNPKKCFASDDIALLAVRKDFELLVPKLNPLKLTGNKMMSILLTYFYTSHRMILSCTDPGVHELLDSAFYDMIGAYMYSYMLPMARVSYYAGIVSLDVVEKIEDILDQCKSFLNTYGRGWKEPRADLLKQAAGTGIVPLLIPDEPVAPSCCANLDLTSVDEREDHEEMIVSLPKLEPLDSEGNLGNIWLPFRNKRTFNLRAYRSAYILVKFYDTVTRCYRFQGICQDTFNDRLKSWLTDNLLPHITDDVFYPGLGAFLRILQNMETSRLKKSNNAALISDEDQPAKPLEKHLVKREKQFDFKNADIDVDDGNEEGFESLAYDWFDGDEPIGLRNRILKYQGFEKKLRNRHKRRGMAARARNSKGAEWYKRAYAQQAEECTPEPVCERVTPKAVSHPTPSCDQSQPDEVTKPDLAKSSKIDAVKTYQHDVSKSSESNVSSDSWDQTCDPKPTKSPKPKFQRPTMPALPEESSTADEGWARKNARYIAGAILFLFLIGFMLWYMQKSGDGDACKRPCKAWFAEKESDNSSKDEECPSETSSSSSTSSLLRSDKCIPCTPDRTTAVDRCAAGTAKNSTTVTKVNEKKKAGKNKMTEAKKGDDKKKDAKKQDEKMRQAENKKLAEKKLAEKKSEKAEKKQTVEQQKKPAEKKRVGLKRGTSPAPKRDKPEISKNGRKKGGFDISPIDSRSSSPISSRCPSPFQDFEQLQHVRKTTTSSTKSDWSWRTTFYSN